MKYRSILYSHYFSNQSGRTHTASPKILFENEKIHFKNEIIPLLPSDKSVEILDLGCGNGSLLSVMKDMGYKNLRGIDVSREQVDKAHEFGVAEVYCMDIQTFIQQNSQNFDIICGMDIIEHFTKDEVVELLILLKHKLKSGGKLILRTPNADAPLANIYCIGDFTHETQLNANSAMQLLLSIGFHEIKILPSCIRTSGILKEMIRKVLWSLVVFKLRLHLFASGRSSKNVLFTPNMILLASKS